MNNRIVTFLFVLGILIPTSINHTITNTFVGIGCMILLFSIVVLLFRQKIINKYSFFIMIIINMLLLLFTLITPLNDYKFGTFLYFIILTMIFCLDFKNYPLDIEQYRKTLLLVNFIMIFFSLSIILGLHPINNIISSWYAAFYNELLPNMIFYKKPVATFATHSIAGFYFFIFFLMNIITFYYLKRKVHLFMSFFYMVFLFYIRSSTSLVYLIVCFIILLIFVYKYNKFIFLFILSLFVIYLMINIRDIALVNMAISKLTSERNGLFVRYAKGGVLGVDINYIINHPFRGLGFNYSSKYRYVDSGFVEYALRGSVFVLFLIFTSLYLFFKRNLQFKFTIMLFLIFLSFEVGFSNLIYYRTLFILPFITAYLAQIEKVKHS